MYQELELLSNKILAKEIRNNVDFVKKYLDKVENFDSETDKQIAYKQLGVIVFSCIEAICKGLVKEVHNRCIKHKCQEEVRYSCNYFAKYKLYDDKKFNNAKIEDVLNHLFDMRLMYLSASEMIQFKALKDLRNHVHISRIIIDGDKSESFNKQLVNDLLKYCDETIDQLGLCDWYLKDNNSKDNDSCIKELDADGYETTQDLREKENNAYRVNRLYCIINKLFSDKEISDEEERILKGLSHCKLPKNDKKSTEDENEKFTKSIVDMIGKELYYKRARFRTDKEYQEKLNKFYDNLRRHSNAKEEIVNEIKLRRQYYDDLNNGRLRNNQ